MSIEAAAAKLDTVPHAGMTYSWFDDDWMTTCSWGPPHSQALATLLRAINNDADLAPQITEAAAALAAVLDPPPAPLSPLPNQEGNDD